MNDEKPKRKINWEKLEAIMKNRPAVPVPETFNIDDIDYEMFYLSYT